MEKNNNIIVPIAIIIAGAFVAGAIYFSGTGTSDKPANKEEEKKMVVKPVDSSDHIFGNPNAPIVIVEYSDAECPYCKTFHGTMNKIMDTYGKDGKVAWVYRHFPLDSAHSKARTEAEATECAADLGGNDTFWKYLNRMMELTPSNNGLDLALLPDIAEEVGLDRNSFEECLSSGRMAETVENQFQSGVDAGIRGTPFSVIITSKDGEMYPVNGAQSYNTVKTIIDAGLADLEN